MEKQKIILTFISLFVCLPSAVHAKSPGVLLQEGLYAEETEGDLDKAIGIYKQVLEQTGKIERIAAKATYQLGMCSLKKGENQKAAEYFKQVVSNYPDQEVLVKKANQQLEKIAPAETDKNLFDILGTDVCSYIGSKYGETCAEAGVKKLYSNSHIYFVDNNFLLQSGGMGYIYNWTGEPITKHYRISGTSYPSQKLYDITGNPMDTEIAPDEQRKGFYHIYWNPKEPLAPGQFFNYGWSLNDTKGLQLNPLSKQCSLRMNNHFGNQVVETFFLVLPENIKLTSPSEDFTAKETFNNFVVYHWKKEVPQNTDHTVDVSLEKTEIKYSNHLGPVIEKTVNDDGVGEDFMLDLDTGELFSVEDAKKWSEKHGTNNKKSVEDFIMKTGIDITGETSKKCLIGVNMVAIPVQKERWDISIEDIQEQVSMGIPGTPVAMSAEGELPKTFVFKTGQGTMGLLQITEMQDGTEPRHFKVRYKTLQRQTAYITDPGQVSEIIRQLVLTVSTCAETDPKVNESLEKIKDLDQKLALNEINRYLLAPEDTVRRSAIFFCWRGQFNDISPCLENLRNLCSHDEDFTRGMAALALGMAKDTNSFDALVKMTLEDKSGYARRCGAYALGLMGDKRALETLEKALKDSDKGVKNNAEAAVTMLTELKAESRTDKQEHLKTDYPISQQIENLIKEMHESLEFKAVDKIVKIGKPAVEPLIAELEKSNDWKVAKALGHLKDHRAIEPLLKKWASCDTSPMKEVIAESLKNLTGSDFGIDRQKWQDWWEKDGQKISPETTITGFMSAAAASDVNRAMEFVAPESHDYEDIKKAMGDNGFLNILLSNADAKAPVRILKINKLGNICTAVWQITFRQDFTIEGQSFKTGDTFDLDGDLYQYGEKWLITGI